MKNLPRNLPIRFDTNHAAVSDRMSARRNHTLPEALATTPNQKVRKSKASTARRRSTP